MKKLEDRIIPGYIYRFNNNGISVDTGYSGTIEFIKAMKSKGLTDDFIRERLFIIINNEPLPIVKI